MSLSGTALDNDYQVENTKVQTVDATQTTVWSKSIGAGCTYKVRLDIVATKSDGSNRASFSRAFTVWQNGVAGGATFGGAVVVPDPDYFSDVTWGALAVSVSGASVLVQFTGKVATTINVRTRVEFVAG